MIGLLFGHLFELGCRFVELAQLNEQPRVLNNSGDALTGGNDRVGCRRLREVQAVRAILCGKNVPSGINDAHAIRLQPFHSIRESGWR